MKRINLIPPELRVSARHHKLKKYLWDSPVSRMLVVLFLLLCCAFVYLFALQFKLQFQVAQQKKNLKTLEVQLERGKDEQLKLKAQIQAAEQENTFLTKRISFLEKAKQEAVKWSGVISTFSKLIPSTMWLNKMSLNKELITLDGAASNNNIVSDFMVKLDESGYFSATNFNFTRKRKDAKDNTRELPVTDFEIITKLGR